MKTIGISMTQRHVEIADSGPSANRAKNVRAILEYFHEHLEWDGIDEFGNVKILCQYGDGCKAQCQ